MHIIFLKQKFKSMSNLRFNEIFFIGSIIKPKPYVLTNNLDGFFVFKESYSNIHKFVLIDIHQLHYPNLFFHIKILYDSMKVIIDGLFSRHIQFAQFEVAFNIAQIFIELSIHVVLSKLTCLQGFSMTRDKICYFFVPLLLLTTYHYNIFTMSKNYNRSTEKGLIYKVIEASRKNLKFTLKTSSNNRRVHTQANERLDKIELGKVNTKYQFAFNQPAQKSHKKYIPVINHEKKFSQIKNPFIDTRFLDTLTRNMNQKKETNKEKLDTVEKESRILKRQPKELRKTRNLYTETDDVQVLQVQFNDRTSDLYKRLSAVSKQKPKPKNPQQIYKPVEVIGKGTFGTVFKATNRDTLETVAIKKVLQDKRYKNRELQILKMLHHPNVLQIKDSYYTVQNQQQYLNVVMEYFEQTLYSFNKTYIKNLTTIPAILIKIFSYQLFRALHYLSLQSIAHRDIKPHNILIDPKTNRVLICDFGSAKQLVKTQSNIAYICSRCYRAPQLIFGATDYSTQIDMWSIGCVIVEMVNGEPPFLGDSQIDQLVQIIKVLGTPSKQVVLQMNRNYDLREYKFPNIKPKEWKKILRGKPDPLLIELLNSVMQYSPIKRISPFEAMCHPYFDDLRTQSKFTEISNRVKIPDLFNFSGQQLSSHKKFADKLIPGWYAPHKL